VWIAGSTQDPEEKIVLEVFSRLQKEFPGLRLFLVPRQRERFDEVARLLQRSGLAFIRRTELLASSPHSLLHPFIFLGISLQQGATERTIECLDQLIGSPLKKAA